MVQQDVVDTFHKAYDAEVAKHLEQEEEEKQRVLTQELKEQARRRASVLDSYNTRDAQTGKKAGKAPAKSTITADSTINMDLETASLERLDQ